MHSINSVYISIPVSQFIPFPAFPPWCPYAFSLPLCSFPFASFCWWGSWLVCLAGGVVFTDVVKGSPSIQGRNEPTWATFGCHLRVKKGWVLMTFLCWMGLGRGRLKTPFRSVVLPVVGFQTSLLSSYYHSEFTLVVTLFSGFKLCLAGRAGEKQVYAILPGLEVLFC